MSSDSALELGKFLSFDYALVPHVGAWQDAQVFRAGLEFNNRLIVRKTSAHAGGLPSLWSFLDVSNPHVVVSALKPSRNGEAAVRVYEAAGQPAQDVRMHFARSLPSARDPSLIEDRNANCKCGRTQFLSTCGRGKSRTFRLRLDTR
jgi:alpha-mannosidase